MKPAEADARIVRLDATDVCLDSLAALAAQIPLASTLAPRTPVLILAIAVRRGGGLFRRLMGDASVAVPRHLRCGALLLRGYVDIGADTVHAWGYAPEG